MAGRGILSSRQARSEWRVCRHKGALPFAQGSGRRAATAGGGWQRAMEGGGRRAGHGVESPGSMLDEFEDEQLAKYGRR